jgi:hypothetical protein
MEDRVGSYREESVGTATVETGLRGEAADSGDDRLRGSELRTEPPVDQGIVHPEGRWDLLRIQTIDRIVVLG